MLEHALLLHYKDLNVYWSSITFMELKNRLRSCNLKCQTMLRYSSDDRVNYSFRRVSHFSCVIEGTELTYLI